MQYDQTSSILTKYNDFIQSWQKTIKIVLAEGAPLRFGSQSEPKMAREIAATVILIGEAVKQVERHETHPDYEFGGRRLEEYCKEFTQTYYEEYCKKPENEKFDYLYYERLTQPVDQLYEMYKNLARQRETGIASNFCQATTWKPYEDGTFKKSSPCLQRIWLRWYENDEIDVHLSWRSRDLYGAWPSNIIAIIQMLNNEVIKPNGCKIVRIVDQCDSLHIYERDITKAKQIRYVATFHGV